MPDSEISAQQLRTERERRGMKQAAFAELLNVSQRTIVNWERGGVPPRRVTRTLALLNVTGVLSVPPALEPRLSLARFSTQELLAEISFRVTLADRA